MVDWITFIARKTLRNILPIKQGLRGRNDPAVRQISNGQSAYTFVATLLTMHSAMNLSTGKQGQV